MKKAFAVLAFSSMSAFAAQWSGVISDEKCGARHTDASEASQACVQKCVKGGGAAVFVTSDNKVLKIDSSSTAKIMPHLGHKVTITGTLSGDTVKVDSVKM